MAFAESLLNASNVFQKLQLLDRMDYADTDIKRLGPDAVPVLPARDIQVVNAKDMPSRKGFSYREGQGRLMHDLANIELQATELCYRGLLDFPEAPEQFR